MAVSPITCFLQITDANGDPVSGAKVNVYDAGTTTPKSLFSDTGLSVGAANPIVCDSSGRSAMRYFANGTYKIAVTTSAGASLYTQDNIDPGVPLGAGALAIASGGTGATTAGGARTNLDVPSNATVTAIASDVASLQASVSAITGLPQGRLTLTTGTPVMVTDVSAGTSVYYTPYVGSQIPIWNSTAFVNTTFSELTLALVSNHVASTAYDLFVINDSSTIRLVSGPAWNVSTAGSGARGSGAGTTELTRQSGVLVNANTITGRYGASTVSVPAKQGTYVGSMFMDGTNGQLTCHFAFGQSRKFGLWNCYNRKRIILKAGDSTASWTYSTNTLRASNGSSSNSLTVFCGLAEEMIDLEFQQQLSTNTATTRIGIGYNSITVSSGRESFGQSVDTQKNNTGLARYFAPPSLGANVATSLECAINVTSTLYGTETNMTLSAEYLG